MNAITPFPIVEVALSKLDPSPANVRKTGRDAGIEELAASIEAHGLLQSLLVRPKGRGRYEVIAGGRRHAALRLLASRKRLSKSAPIVCWKLDHAAGASGATEASLAENAMRRDMHPADEFEAFALLHRGGEGLGIEEIGARYGVTPAVVRQRLRLAEVSPVIIAAYREGTLTLDDVMAFAVTDDHAAQERVHRDLLPWQRSPATIRRLLTQALLPTTDKRVLLVGLDAYAAAGGRVQRDLFTEDGGGWIADAALLEHLVGERMEAEAEALRAEGWRWVAVGDAAAAETYRCRRVWPTRAALTEAEEARRDDLAARSDEIAADYAGADDLPEEIAAELDGIEAELAGLERREEAWRPEDVALAGCVLTLAGDGRLSVARGLVRPEDEPKPEPVVAAEDAGEAGDETTGESVGSDDAPDGAADAEDEERDDHLPPLTAALSAELDAHRTLALRAELAGLPDLALRVLVHSLAGDAFFGRGYGETVANFPAYAPGFHGVPGLGDSPAKHALDEAEARERAAIPAERRDLWAWVAAQDTPTLLELLAVCVARVADGGHGDWIAGGLRAEVGRAAGLDMRRWWTATPDAYLARVPKAAILAAVREGAGEAAAARMAGWKKAPMVAEAATLLDGTGWLPTRLRVPGGKPEAAPAGEGSGADEATADLPEAEDVEARHLDDAQPWPMAAE